MDVEKFLTAAIPQEIREIQHQDGELIRACLVSALSAYHESDGVRDVTIARDIHKSLLVTLQTEILPHLTKEDEDWNGLKSSVEMAKAEAEAHKARAASVKTVRIVSSGEYMPGVTEYMVIPSDHPDQNVPSAQLLTRDYDGAWKAHLRSVNGESLGKGEGSTEQTAMDAAASNAGYVLVRK